MLHPITKLKITINKKLIIHTRWTQTSKHEVFSFKIISFLHNIIFNWNHFNIIQQ